MICFVLINFVDIVKLTVARMIIYLPLSMFRYMKMWKRRETSAHSKLQTSIIVEISIIPIY